VTSSGGNAQVHFTSITGRKRVRKKKKGKKTNLTREVLKKGKGADIPILVGAGQKEGGQKEVRDKKQVKENDKKELEGNTCKRSQGSREDRGCKWGSGRQGGKRRRGKKIKITEKGGGTSGVALTERTRKKVSASEVCVAQVGNPGGGRWVK